MSHTSSLGLAHSCLLSADEVEVLGGMERTWHGSYSLGMRADPDKRISNDGYPVVQSVCTWLSSQR